MAALVVDSVNGVYGREKKLFGMTIATTLDMEVRNIIGKLGSILKISLAML